MASPLEFDIYISPDGLRYYFDDGVDRFAWGFNGEGLPPIEYLTQRGPYQQGETVLDFRLRPRQITLIHRRNMNCRDDYWDARLSTINYLRPNRQTIGEFETGVLRKRLPDGTLRDLNVLYQEGLNFDKANATAWDEYSFQQAIRFIAFDPLYYNPTVVSNSFTVESDDELVFPITFPIEFGTAFIDDTLNITYEGTFPAFPTLVFVGPVKGPTIVNQTTGETITLNYDVPAGVTVTISLREGNKTVVDSLGNNLIGTISLDSDLATFHLEPAPGAVGGLNVLTITGAGAQPGETVLTITYQERFIGI